MIDNSKLRTITRLVIVQSLYQMEMSGTDINVLLKDSQTSDGLLNFISNKAKVQHFKEVIPSANDIFIKSVKEN